jgi:hypothetical protein
MIMMVRKIVNYDCQIIITNKMRLSWKYGRRCQLEVWLYTGNPSIPIREHSVANQSDRNDTMAM